MSEVHIIDAVNRFRHENGRPIVDFNVEMSHNCFLHCLSMAKAKNIFHAEECYLEGWQEAVGVISYGPYAVDRLIFDILAASQKHRNVLLDCSELAGAVHISNWYVFLTIRGR